jgi:hydroxymethylbilane synthase
MVAHLLAQGHRGLGVEVVVVRTEGDRRSEEPLEQIGGQGVFVKEIQQALLDGRADVAVHSAKDLPPEAPTGLELAAVPGRGDVRDALVGSTLSGLGSGALVATGAARRRAQLANLRPDLCFTQLRGNVETRVAMAGIGGVEAVVVAAAALERLSISSQAAEVLSPTVMLPQVGQGAIALECRVEDEAVRALLASIDDDDAHRAVVAERAMLNGLGASCSLPVGGWAEPAGLDLHLRGMVASADGRVVLHADAYGDDPSALGAHVAQELLVRHGAADLLGQGQRVPRPAR